MGFLKATTILYTGALYFSKSAYLQRMIIIAWPKDIIKKRI